MTEKRKTGRPELSPEERRTERFNLRFTVSEKRKIQRDADLAGLSAHEYLRRRGLEHRVVPSGARVDPGLVTELNRLALEISALGNNVNQIARSLNARRRVRHDWDATVEAIEALSQRATEALERILAE